MRITILTETELRRCVEIDRTLIRAIEEGFARLAAGDVSVPPIMRIDFPESNGEVDVKSAYVRGLDSFAVKVSSGFFDNARYGLPSLSGLMLLLSATTGVPEAVLLDNGYLTDVRTGAAGAVAAEHLAPAEVVSAGIIGTGAQARWQIKALKLVRDFSQLRIYGRTAANVERYAAEMEEALGVEVIPCDDPATVVRNSQVVVTTTPARDGYLRADWLHPGLHITAVGSDAEEKQELAAEVLQQADRIVCDLKAQCLRLGELHHAVDADLLPADAPKIAELGDVIAERQPGRRSQSEITVCDLTGVGLQDSIIAHLAYQRAIAEGYGAAIENQPPAAGAGA